MKPVKLFFYPNLVSKRASIAFLLNSYLGPNIKETIPFDAFKKLNLQKNYLLFVNEPEKSDCILLPNYYWTLIKNDRTLFRTYLQNAKDMKKPLLIDASGDPADPVKAPYSIVLRNSVYRSTKRENEIVLPAFVEDLLESYCDGKLKMNKLATVPSVGFVGWGKAKLASTPIAWARAQLTLALRHLYSLKPQTQGLILRQQMLQKLEEEECVKTNFILRENYSGHLDTIDGNVQVVRNQFVKNIISNDYTVCIRGAGNYSSRFFETLSLGRIPLVLDTDIVLPLEKVVNYKEFCVFLEVKEIDLVGKILLDFHKNISVEQFSLMQKKARAAFAGFLRVDSFTKYLAAEILKKIEYKQIG